MTYSTKSSKAGEPLLPVAGNKVDDPRRIKQKPDTCSRLTPLALLVFMAATAVAVYFIIKKYNCITDLCELPDGSFDLFNQFLTNATCAGNNQPFYHFANTPRQLTDMCNNPESTAAALFRRHNVTPTNTSLTDVISDLISSCACSIKGS